MRRVALTLAAVFAAGAALTGTAQATPAVGEVIVYSLDTMPVAIFDNPKGCYSIPVGAHVLINRTNRPVEIYPNPACLLLPILTLKEDTGAHAPPAAGSFRV
ncbi:MULTISPECIES: hypothetical protein [unclassified Crossiella]|uniref:hypothetical protein n=1 Tax=unclassified Crossiella TaxID=2620835 RepID=UPI002000185A|nr:MULTISPECIES: hypothetical protein [unclassified Crossiella]MCK2241566.1 hypothetical protein [Crossiella sp. S99.2]MCK2255562.1 hypothetical protein [Crossiella sp. S99.1]